MRLPKLKRILQWAVLAQPRRGGRALPVAFTFGDAFLHGIEQVLDNELGWKEKHRTNGRDRTLSGVHGLD